MRSGFWIILALGSCFARIRSLRCDLILARPCGPKPRIQATVTCNTNCERGGLLQHARASGLRARIFNSQETLRLMKNSKRWNEEEIMNYDEDLKWIVEDKNTKNWIIMKICDVTLRANNLVHESRQRKILFTVTSKNSIWEWNYKKVNDILIVQE